MKNEIKRQVGFYQVDAHFFLRFKSLLHFFQDSTAVHSEKSGCGIRRLMGQKRAWVLYRICIRVLQTPCLGDDLQILTWSRGKKGFRAYRDFEIYCNGEKQVSATSLWLFIDLDKKKILKVPAEADQWYAVEKDQALDVDIDAVNPNPRFHPDMSETIDIRFSDHDPLGHVNNALYLDFLENLIHQRFNDTARLKQVVIQFNNEIPKALTRVNLGIRREPGLNEFKLFSPECVHAAGMFDLFDSGI